MTIFALIAAIVAAVLFVVDFLDSRRATRGNLGYLTALGLAVLTLALIFQFAEAGDRVTF